MTKYYKMQLAAVCDSTHDLQLTCSTHLCGNLVPSQICSLLAHVMLFGSLDALLRQQNLNGSSLHSRNIPSVPGAIPCLASRCGVDIIVITRDQFCNLQEQPSTSHHKPCLHALPIHSAVRCLSKREGRWIQVAEGGYAAQVTASAGWMDETSIGKPVALMLWCPLLLLSRYCSRHPHSQNPGGATPANCKVTAVHPSGRHCFSEGVSFDPACFVIARHGMLVDPTHSEDGGLRLALISDSTHKHNDHSPPAPH